jgi:hypothetical protein
MNTRMHPDDEEFEKLVAAALREPEAGPDAEGVPPSSAIVWWRSQMRAKQEARKAAERPMAIVHALSIACVAGLTLGVIGLALAWARSAGLSLDVSQFLTSARTAEAASSGLSGWMLPVAATGVTLIVASIAVVYVLFADE